MAKKDWTIAEDGLSAERTASFGANPWKVHRVFGVDEKQTLEYIKDFDERLKVANGDDGENDGE